MIRFCFLQYLASHEKEESKMTEANKKGVNRWSVGCVWSNVENDISKKKVGGVSAGNDCVALYICIWHKRGR